ncbi:MAG: four helix bundle protein [Candidatus Marinimicrobia bacterium]|nr:four helix bundle protein [Candidatus Neomarinimicrobiota bacterium]
MAERSPIKSFKDLEVYQNSYRACVNIMKQLLPNLPESEKFDLRDQLSRSVKAVPRLIAEGYAKRHQKYGFQKYLDDAMAECNETIVGLEMCRDIYGDYMQDIAIARYIDLYDKTGRQIYNLSKTWSRFKDSRRI